MCWLFPGRPLLKHPRLLALTSSSSGVGGRGFFVLRCDRPTFKPSQHKNDQGENCIGQVGGGPWGWGRARGGCPVSYCRSCSPGSCSPWRFWQSGSSTGTGRRSRSRGGTSAPGRCCSGSLWQRRGDVCDPVLRPQPAAESFVLPQCRRSAPVNRFTHCSAPDMQPCGSAARVSLSALLLSQCHGDASPVTPTS